ncbi:MAG: YkvA family protein [Burkholderiales bacterium]
MGILQTLRARARQLKADTLALWFCLRDPRTPLAAKLVAGIVVAYALSPIDLIPDFIPVLGYLDELILVPAGLWLALKLVPPAVMADNRQRAEQWFAEGRLQPRNLIAAAVILALWTAAGALLVYWLVRTP